MKNQKIVSMLSNITESRTKKYAEEVARQKAVIEEALVNFLEERKAAFEGMNRATVLHQTNNYLWFQFELDARVLPEVANYIAEEFDLKVDNDKPHKVYGEYEA